VRQVLETAKPIVDSGRRHSRVSPAFLNLGGKKMAGPRTTAAERQAIIAWIHRSIQGMQNGVVASRRVEKLAAAKGARKLKDWAINNRKYCNHIIGFLKQQHYLLSKTRYNGMGRENARTKTKKSVRSARGKSR